MVGIRERCCKYDGAKIGLVLNAHNTKYLTLILILVLWIGLEITCLFDFNFVYFRDFFVLFLFFFAFILARKHPALVVCYIAKSLLLFDIRERIGLKPFAYNLSYRTIESTFGMKPSDGNGFEWRPQPNEFTHTECYRIRNLLLILVETRNSFE